MHFMAEPTKQVDAAESLVNGTIFLLEHRVQWCDRHHQLFRSADVDVAQEELLSDTYCAHWSALGSCHRRIVRK